VREIPISSTMVFSMENFFRNYVLQIEKLRSGMN
jgi:hypothetical protein